MDPLGYLDEIPICIGYEIDGVTETDFPSTTKLERAKPVWKTMPGWKTDITGIRQFDMLPQECQDYIQEIEKEIGFPITMISNGPGRDDIIFRTPKL